MSVTGNLRIRAEAPQKLSIRCALGDVFVRNLTVSAVFAYDYRLDTAALTRSLACVLGDFAPFNARLRRRGLEHFIECGDNGCGFSVHNDSRALREMVGRLDARARLGFVDAVRARRAWSRADPVITFRVTHFSDQRSLLGISWHHGVGDWSSVMSLLKAWSMHLRGLAYDKPLVVADRDAYLDSALPRADNAAPNLRHTGLGELSKLGWGLLTTARGKRQVAFDFDPEELERMRAALQRESGRKLTLNDALCGHVSGCVSAYDVRWRPQRRLSIVVNYRRRTGLADNLLGNCVSTVDVACNTGDGSQVAAALREGLDSFSDKHLNHHVNKRLVERHGGIANINRFLPLGVDPSEGSLLFSSWTRFGIYDVDLGAGGPSHFWSAGTLPIPWLGVLHEGFRNRGLRFELMLPGTVAARLQSEAGLREVHRYRTHAARTSARSEEGRLSRDSA